MATAVFRIEAPVFKAALDHLTKFEKNIGKIEKRLQGLKKLGGGGKLTLGGNAAGGIAGGLSDKLQTVRDYTSRLQTPLDLKTAGISSGSGLPASGKVGDSGAQGGGTAARPETTAGGAFGESFLGRIENSLTRAGETLTTIQDFIGKVKDTVKGVNDLINTFKSTIKSVLEIISLFKSPNKGAGSAPKSTGSKKTAPLIKEKENSVKRSKSVTEKSAAAKNAKKNMDQIQADQELQHKSREKTKSIISGKDTSGKTGSTVKQAATKGVNTIEPVAAKGFPGKLLQAGRRAMGKAKGLKIPYVDIALGAAEIISAGKGNRWAKAKELVVEKGGSAVGTALGTLVGGPLGGAVGAQLGSLAGEKLFGFLESKFGSDREKGLAPQAAGFNEPGVGTGSLSPVPQPVPYQIPAEKARQELQVTVNVSPEFNINTYVDAGEVLKVIKANLNALTEEIGDRMAESLQGRWSNTVLDGGH
ncbi:MAG: hypothetical protein ACOWWO_12080 [Peptococcaceae bacterium]